MKSQVPVCYRSIIRWQACQLFRNIWVRWTMLCISIFLPENYKPENQFQVCVYIYFWVNGEDKKFKHNEIIVPMLTAYIFPRGSENILQSKPLLSNIKECFWSIPSDEKFSMLILKNPINHPWGKLVVHDLMPMPKKPML